MKIKNIKNNRIDTVAFKEWKDDYINKGIYKDYEIIDYFGLVEIHHLLKDGSTRFTFMRKSDAVKQKNQHPNQYEIKDLSFVGYDKWLVKEEIQSLFFRLRKMFKYQKPNIKLDIHSKRHMTIVVLMILTLFGMFYIAYKQGAFN